MGAGYKVGDAFYSLSVDFGQFTTQIQNATKLFDQFVRQIDTGGTKVAQVLQTVATTATAVGAAVDKVAQDGAVLSATFRGMADAVAPVAASLSNTAKSVKELQQATSTVNQTLTAFSTRFNTTVTNADKAAQSMQVFSAAVAASAQNATQFTASLAAFNNDIKQILQNTTRANAVLNDLSQTVKRIDTNTGQTNTSVQRMGQQMDVLSRSGGVLNAMFGSMGNVIKSTITSMLTFQTVQPIFNGIGDVLGMVKDGMIGMNAQLQQSSIGWTFLLKSADNARGMLQAIMQIAAATPFSFPQLESAARRFMAVGVAAKDVLPTLIDIGNAVAGVGGSKENLQSITDAIARMQATTRVFARDLNTIAAAGLPAWEILSQATHKSVAQLRIDVRAGRIDAQTFIDAFRQFSQVNFAGAMETQSHTFLGALETIKDNLRIFGATAFKPVFDVIARATDRIAQFTRTPAFAEWATKIAAVLSVVVDGLSSLVGGFQGAFSSILSVVSSVGQAIYTALQWINPFARHSPSLVEQVQTGTQAILDSYARLGKGVPGLMDSAAAAVRAFSATIAAGMKEVQDATNATEAATLSVFGKNAPQAYLNATAAVQKLEDQLPGLNSAVKTQEGVVASWKSKVDAASVSIKGQEAVIRTASAALKPYEAAVKDAEAAVTAQEQAIKQAEAALRPYAQAVTAAEAAVKGQEAAIRTAEAGLRTYQDAVTRAKNAVDDEQQTIDAMTAALKPYEDAVNTAKDAVDRHKESVDAAKTAYDDLKSQIKDAQDALKNWSDAPLKGTKAFQDQLNAIEDQTNRLELKKINLQIGGGSKDDIKAVQDELDTLKLKADQVKLQEKVNLDPLRRQLDDLKNTAPEYTFDQIKKGILGAQQQVDSLTARLGPAKVALDAQSSALDRAQAALKATEKTRDEHKAAIDRESTALDNLKVNLQTAERALKTHQDAIQPLRDKLDVLKTGVDNARAALDKHKDAIQPLNDRLDALKSKVDDARAALDKQKDAIQPLQDKLDDLRTTHDKLQESYDKENTKLAAIRDRYQEVAQAARDYRQTLKEAVQGAAAQQKLGIDEETNLLGDISGVDTFLNPYLKQLDDMQFKFTTFKQTIEDNVITPIKTAFAAFDLGKEGWWNGPGTKSLTDFMGRLGKAYREDIKPVIDGVRDWINGDGSKVPGFLQNQGSATDGLKKIIHGAFDDLHSFSGWLQGIPKWVEDNKVPMAVITGLVTALGARLAITTGVMAWNALVTKDVAGGIKIWTAAQWLLNTALDANPISLVVIALAGLAGGLYYAYTHSETFRKAVDGVGHALSLLPALLSENKGLLATLGAITAAVAGQFILATAAMVAHRIATAAATVATIAHTAVTKTVTAVTTVWTVAQWALNAALSANPIGLVVIGLAGLVVALKLAYDQSETFRKAVDGLATGIHDWNVTASADVNHFFDNFGTKVKDWNDHASQNFNTGLATLGTNIHDWNVQKSDDVNHFFSNFGTKVNDWYTTSSAKVETFFINFGTRVVTWVTENSPRIVTFFGTFKQQVHDWDTTTSATIIGWIGDYSKDQAGFLGWIGFAFRWLDGHKQAFITMLNAPFAAAAGAIGSIMQAFPNAVTTAMNAVIDVLNKTLGKFGEFVNAFRGVVNFISQALGQGDLFKDPYTAPQIQRLAVIAPNSSDLFDRHVPVGGSNATFGFGSGEPNPPMGSGPSGNSDMPLPTADRSDPNADTTPSLADRVGTMLKGGIGGLADWFTEGASTVIDKAFAASGLNDLKFPGFFGELAGPLTEKVKGMAVTWLDGLLQPLMADAGFGGRGAIPASLPMIDRLFALLGLSGSRITSTYYDHRASTGIHGGWDLAGLPEGTPILAPLDAIVRTLPTHPEFGQRRMLDMAKGWSMYFGHLSRFIGPDGPVKAGHAFAALGHTGLPGIGNHVHWQLHHNGPKVDPAVALGQYLAEEGLLGDIPAVAMSSGTGSGGIGNWGNPSGALLNAIIGTGKALTNWGPFIDQSAHGRGIPDALIMTLLGHESSFGSFGDGLTKYNNFTGLTGTGWPGQVGTTRGMARPFAEFASVGAGITAAEDNLLRGYRGLTLRQILSKWLTGSISGSGDPEGNTTSAYLNYAKYMIGRVGGSYNPDVLRFAAGGRIDEHIAGIGLRSGKLYEMGEKGIEYVIPDDKLGRGGHVFNTTVYAQDARITEERMARILRQEMWLNGF